MVKRRARHAELSNALRVACAALDHGTDDCLAVLDLERSAQPYSPHHRYDPPATAISGRRGQAGIGAFR